jgi:hypothetical protein
MKWRSGRILSWTVDELTERLKDIEALVLIRECAEIRAP